MPPLPNNFVELNINGEFALTTGGTPFLRYDNKSENNPIILLGCDQTIKIIREANDWFMDGTFKSAPDELLQIYTLQGRLDGHLFLSIYLLIKTKDEKSYREAFGQLKDIANEKNVIFE